MEKTNKSEFVIQSTRLNWRVFHGRTMDLDNFKLDERALAEADQRREQKLTDDEEPIEADNDCGGACTI